MKVEIETDNLHVAHKFIVKWKTYKYAHIYIYLYIYMKAEISTCLCKHAHLSTYVLQCNLTNAFGTVLHVHFMCVRRMQSERNQFIITQ